MSDTDTIAPSCHDCGEAYGSPRFPDLVLPHDMWAKISPSGDENGLLCPNCMCARATAADIECRAVFRSGPFFGAGGTHEAMNAQPDTIARLTAELAEARRERDAALAGAVEVRPMVWSPVESWKQCSRERAPAFGGEYQIVMLDPGEDELPSLYFEIGLGAFMFRFEQDQDPMGLPGETCPRKFPSVEAAKAAAQADYRARILTALHPSPDALAAQTEEAANG